MTIVVATGPCFCLSCQWAGREVHPRTDGAVVLRGWLGETVEDALEREGARAAG